MHLASSDGQVHEMVSHLGSTHLALEPVCIATFRIFDQNHPIFLLLKPHMRQTIAINELGRRTLLNKGGFFDSITSLGMVGTLRLMEVAWKNFRYMERSFPIMSQSRGFPKVPQEKIATSDDTLPGYLYRDYGYIIWDAIYLYVEQVIEKVYLNDKAVADDFLLQKWAYEISHKDFGNLPGFPSKILTKKELIDVCAIFINTASAQHSAVNFGQFDFYGFIPYRPLALVKKMPDITTNLTMSYVIDALPNRIRTLKQMAITYVLSMHPSVVPSSLLNPKLGTYLGTKLSEALDITEVFWQPHYQNEWEKLYITLRDATNYMINYNKIHGYVYKYLYLDDIALSIAI